MTDNQDDDAAPSRHQEWIDNLWPRAVERILERCGYGEELAPFVRVIVKEAVRETFDEMEGMGFCSFYFHQSIAEFRDDDTCEVCDKPRSEHPQVRICQMLDDSRELEQTCAWCSALIPPGGAVKHREQCSGELRRIAASVAEGRRQEAKR